MTPNDLPRVGSPRWRAWLKARAEGWRLDHWLQIEGPKHSNDVTPPPTPHPLLPLQAAPPQVGYTGRLQPAGVPLSAPTPPVPTPKPAPPPPPKRIEDIPVFGEEPANPDPWEGFDPTREP